MSRSLPFLGIAAFLAAGVAGGVLLAGRTERPGAPGDPAEALQSAFNRAAERGTRSVVHLTTRSRGPRGTVAGGEDVGSGVIVTAEGHIVTSHHVIQAAKSVTVRFVDGAEFAAKLVGTDSESDLAVLKIDPEGRTLVPIAFADSDRVRVGDFAFAIGSPYGYNHTVTSGIVSAKHRRVEFGQPYEDFLQTNAAINPGNSGGALVNLDGELIGLNAAIVSQGAGSEGIGLAVASNLVKWVQERLIKEGRVRRGYLGVIPIDLHPKAVEQSHVAGHRRFQGIREAKDLHEELGVPDGRGVLLSLVMTDSPAAAGGLRPLDVVTAIDGRPVRSKHEMFFRVADIEPGTKVRVTYVRDRKTGTADVTVAERGPAEMLGQPRR